MNSWKLTRELTQEYARRVPQGGRFAEGSTEASRAFGRHVQDLREKHGLTRGETGKSTRISVLQLTLIEQGLARKDEITPEVVRSLARVLGDELLRHPIGLAGQ